MKKAEKVDFGGEMARMLPRILREVSRRQKSIFMKGNLTVPDIVVMDALLEKGPCTMGILAKVLGLTTSAATVIVDRMIKKALVKRERSRKDRRVVNVILLKKGEETVKRLNTERRKLTNDMFSVLSEKEREEYLRLIGKVFNSLSKRQ